MCEAYTSSFFGTQPRITQVPPIRYSSASMTRAPWPAAIRAARTPPEPPPMTNRSTSNSAIQAPLKAGVCGSYLLAAFAHLGPEFAIDDFAKLLCPLVHKGHAELNCPRLGGEQFLPQWRFVERDQVFQFLLGELVGVDRRHPLADFLFAASKLLRDDGGYFVEVLLIVEVALHQLIPGLLDDVGDRAGIHCARVLHRKDFPCRRHRRRRSLFERTRSRLLSRCGKAGDGQSQGKPRGRQDF